MITEIYKLKKAFEILRYAERKLQEEIFSLEISALFEKAKKEYNVSGYLNTCDIDKLVRVDDEFKAIIELKYIKHGLLNIRFNQNKTLKLLSEKLQVPVFYVAKNPWNDTYYIVKQVSDQFMYLKDGKTWKAEIPVDSLIEFDEDEILGIFADILRGVEK